MWDFVLEFAASIFNPLKGASKNSEFAQMQGAEKVLVPANLKVTLH